MPVFHNFNREHVSVKPFIVAVFSCMLPGTLVLLIGECQRLSTIVSVYTCHDNPENLDMVDMI